MGVEIFPQLLTFAKIVVGAVGVITVLIMLIAGFEYFLHRDDKDKKKEMKGHIVTSLIAVAIILCVYLFLSAIGPAFRLLFQ